MKCTFSAIFNILYIATTIKKFLYITIPPKTKLSAIESEFLHKDISQRTMIIAWQKILVNFRTISMRADIF